MFFSLLSDLGIEREEVFVTNAVKCRPLNNKTPKASEVKACKKYLHWELEKVKPKYVLLLGSIALKSVIGKGKITEIHGTVIEKDGIKYLPTFHPAASFRDPKKLDQFENDIKRFSKMIRGELKKAPKIEYTLIKSIEDFNLMVEEIKETKVISFDIETTGLNRFKENINLMGIGLKNSHWIISTERFEKDILKQMIKILSRKLKRKKVIMQNGKFDNLFLREKYNTRLNLTFDTMIASYALNENTKNSLKQNVRVIFGVDYDVGLSTKKGISKEALQYLAYDLYYTRKLYFHYKKELKKDPATYKVFRHLLMPVYNTYENVESEGIYINLEQYKETEKYFKEKEEKIHKRLSEYKKGVNWNSYQQVGKFLFEDLKLPIIEKTATGNPATGEPILLRLKDKHPAVETLLEYRGVRQNISHFIDGWKKWIVNNRMYPSFLIHSTVTGRTSCKDPNLQQVPRDVMLRSLFEAPPGWTFIQADYSQVELRVAAILSGDPMMKMIFQTGQDIHTKTARDITGIEDITKEERKMAKAVNFGFLYGMGWKKFVDYARDKYGVNLTDKEAKKFRRRFFESYSYLPKWHDRQRRIVHAQGQVRNLIGRVRRLPEIYSPDEGLVQEAERQSINSPVQSFASDLTLMALIECNKKFSKNTLRCVGTVHDSILMIIKDKYVKDYLPKVKAIMEEPEILRDKFKVKLDIPIIVDIEIGPWGKGVEIEFDKNGQPIID